MVYIHLLLYITSFLLVWIGSGLIIKSVDKLANSLKLSSFIVSFFVLGILTTIPEISVGINSIQVKEPEIFVGNLLGGIIVLFLFIIPLLAIIGNGVNLSRQLGKKTLLLALIVISSTSFFIADQSVGNFEGFFMVMIYVLLLFFIQKRRSLFEVVTQNLIKPKLNFLILGAKVIVGMAIIFFASTFIVEQTIYFATLLNVSTFYISLLGLSLGTNLPEISLAVRSVLVGKKDIAFGDYLGSASANTLLFGILSILYDGKVYINGNFYITFLFITVGLSLFYYFSRSKNNLSRREGTILLTIYIVFIIIELFRYNGV